MCEWCRELDGRIEQCRSIKSETTDPTMLDGIALLVEQYEADKKALHQ